MRKVIESKAGGVAYMVHAVLQLEDGRQVVKSAVYLPNATANTIARWAAEDLDDAESAAAPDADARGQAYIAKRRKELKEIDAFSSWRFIRNPVGNSVLWLYDSPELIHLTNGASRDLDGYIRLVILQAALRRDGVPLAQVAQAVQRAAPELRNPYTGQPMRWDAATATLSFEGRQKTGSEPPRVYTARLKFGQARENMPDSANSTQPAALAAPWIIGFIAHVKPMTGGRDFITLDNHETGIVENAGNTEPSFLLKPTEQDGLDNNGVAFRKNNSGVVTEIREARIRIGMKATWRNDPSSSLVLSFYKHYGSDAKKMLLHDKPYLAITTIPTQTAYELHPTTPGFSNLAHIAEDASKNGKPIDIVFGDHPNEIIYLQYSQSAHKNPEGSLQHFRDGY